MNLRTLAALAALSVLLLAALPALAADRPIVGTERGDRLVAEGVVDAATAPAEIVHEIGEDARNFGPGGLITGSVRGGVQAAGQALRGGARMAVGIMDVLTAPFRDDD